MADTKISALPAATTPLAGTEVLPIVQGGVTDKVSVANLTAGRAIAASSVAVGGATIGTDALAVTGTAAISGNTILGSAAVLGWSTDVKLLRDSANTLALRNGVNAQAALIYNTYTDASNYERLFVGFAANKAFINVQGSGTGVARAISLQSAGVNVLTISTTSQTTLAGGLATPIGSQAGTTYSVVNTDSSIIFTAATTVTVTLPTASSFTGRVLRMKTTGGGSVVSNASNVVPLAGGAAGTAILAATAGTWTELQSDGTNWIVMSGN